MYRTHLTGFSSPCKIFSDFIEKSEILNIGISKFRDIGPVYRWAFTVEAWGSVILVSKVY